MAWKATWRLLKMEIKLFLREPFAMFFTLLFPVILLLLFGSIYGSLDMGNGFRFIDTYVPALFAMVIANLGLMSIPITLADYRERGILKFYRVTPLPQGVLLVVQIAVHLLMFFLSALLVLVVAWLVFGLKFGGSVIAITGVLLLSIAMLYAVGFAIGGLVSTVRTAQTTGTAVFFIMFFTSGAAIPRNEFPEWLKKLTDWIPLSHVVDITTAAWMGESLSGHAKSLVLLAVIFVAALAVAKWGFRWQPS